MIRPSPARLGATLLTPLLVIVAACGGTSASATPAGGTTAPTTTPAPGASTAANNPGSSSDQGSGQPSFEIPSFDLSKLGGAIPGLDSYRVSVTVGGAKQYESVVVEQPVLAKAITIYSGATVSERLVLIGPDAWGASGTDGAFKSMPAGLVNSMLVAFDPSILFGAYASLDWTTVATNQGVETKNGIQAHHIRIDPSSLLGGLASMPPGASIDAWIADAGYLVALETVGADATGSLQIEITNVNDPSNTVEKPS